MQQTDLTTPCLFCPFTSNFLKFLLYFTIIKFKVKEKLLLIMLYLYRDEKLLSFRTRFQRLDQLYCVFVQAFITAEIVSCVLPDIISDCRYNAEHKPSYSLFCFQEGSLLL